MPLYTPRPRPHCRRNKLEAIKLEGSIGPLPIQFIRHHVERVSPLGRCIPCIDSLHCRASEEDGQAKMCLICRAAKKNVKIRLHVNQEATVVNKNLPPLPRRAVVLPLNSPFPMRRSNIKEQLQTKTKVCARPLLPSPLPRWAAVRS